MKSSWSLPRLLTIISLVALVQVAEVTAQVDAVGEAPIATIRAVRFHVEPGRTRVWFETTGAVLYTHYSPDPLTLVIDLPGVDISGLSERTVVGSREVESILARSLQSGVNGRKLSRIEIKLAVIAPYQMTGSEQALNIVFDGGQPLDVPESSSPETLVSEARGEKASAAENETNPTVVESAPMAEPPEPLKERSEEIEASVAAEIREELIAPSRPSMPSHPASAISGISHEILGDVLKVHVSADGRLNYTSFLLEGPTRLVFDFNGVLNAVPRAALNIEELGVARVRVAQFRTAEPRITRVVFDLDEAIAHRAVEGRSGLEIDFATSDDAFAVPAFASMEEADSRDVQLLDEPPLGPSNPDLITVSGETANGGSYSLVQNAVFSSEDGGSFERVTLTAAQDLGLANPGPSLPMPPPPQDTPPPQGPVPGSQLLIGGGTGDLGQTEYTGELISLDFKDGDIQDIFRLFAEISGLNIVVQPGVAGRITLVLSEVPWDQALELILKTNKLGFVAEGNVIRIAPLGELAEEEAQRRQLAEEKALAGELFTRTRVLSYAKASELQPLLQRNLSARGDIVTDERTNTVIYTDLAEQVNAVGELIDSLDTPIPGVEIEARIVVTTRTFSRQLGVQWGFTSNQTQALGNTSELVFPNRVQIDGQAIGADSSQSFVAPGIDTGGLAPPQTLQGTQSAQRGYAVNLPFAGAPTGAIGLSLGSITGAFGIDAALTAAEGRGQVRIISAPKIITQNNQAALIKQGTTFPVQVVANNTITVQFKDAVLELSVTPQITSANTIILDIEVNNDSLDFGQQVNGIPSIVTQAATTQVLVADGSTTVIGGVFVNRTNFAEQYVPLLHRIPVLGYLFKSKTMDTRNEELLIFLTPRIRKDTV